MSLSVFLVLCAQRIQDGDEEVVRDMLKPQQSAEEISIKLCHPLCSCDKCEKVQTTYRNNFNLVTAYTRDNRGYTGQIVALNNSTVCLILWLKVWLLSVCLCNCLSFLWDSFLLSEICSWFLIQFTKLLAMIYRYF